MAALQFAPWSSDIEISFYAALASRKIDHDKLDDAARRVLGRYEVRPTDPPERSALMQMHGNAFTANGYDMRGLDDAMAETDLKQASRRSLSRRRHAQEHEHDRGIQEPGPDSHHRASRPDGTRSSLSLYQRSS